VKPGALLPITAWLKWFESSPCLESHSPNSAAVLLVRLNGDRMYE
jgi:hypothetical protein